MLARMPVLRGATNAQLTAFRGCGVIGDGRARGRISRALPLTIRSRGTSTASAISYAGMSMIRPLTFAALVVSNVFGQGSSVPYASNSDGPGPTFVNEIATSSFNGKYSSIRKVDFRNLKPLKNGRYKEDEGGVHYSEQLEEVYYLTGSATVSAQAALVLYSWFSVGGSSSQGRRALIFNLANGRLWSTQEIRWDTHFQAGQPTDKFDPVTNTLVIRSAHYIPGDAHCCVSAMDVVTYRWDGRVFAQANIQTELSQYGKNEGKKLQR